MSARFRRTGWQRHSRHRHAVGRRRDVRLGHGPLHRRFVVLRRAACRGVHRRRSRGAVRASGGVSAKAPDAAAIDAYLAQVDIPGAIDGLKGAPGRCGGCAANTWRAWPCASRPCGTWPWRSWAAARRSPTTAAWASHRPGAGTVRSGAKRERVAELLGGLGRVLLAAVDAWRASHRVPMASIRLLGAAVDRPLRSIDAGQRGAPPAGANADRFRAPISSSCRSRMPGFPGR